MIECQWKQPLVMYDNTFWPNPAFITVYAGQPRILSLRNRKRVTCFTKSACLIHRYQIPSQLLWGYFHISISLMLVIILDGMHTLCCFAATEQLLSIVSEIIIQGLEEFTFLVKNNKLESESPRLRESSRLSRKV